MSCDYGFGVSAFSCSASFARSVGRLAAQPNCFAELDVDEEQVRLPKTGRAHRLGVHKDRFRTLLSLPRQYEAHSGSLEAAAVSLMLRWLLRSPCTHGRRVAALVDAKSVLGAITKGRSSAPTLKFEVRRIAALSIAGNYFMRYVYVPSAYNPADGPSRGLRQPRQRRLAIKRTIKKPTPAQRSYTDWKKSYNKLAINRMSFFR